MKVADRYGQSLRRVHIILIRKRKGADESTPVTTVES